MYPLTVARLGVAVACAVEGLAQLPILRRLNDPGIVHLPLTWLPYPSDPMALVLVGAWIVCALALAFGFGAGGFGLAACIAYTVLLDQQTYSNHLYLFAILSGLLGFSARGHDVALFLKGQLTLVYFFAAVSKINVAYLSGLLIAGSLRPEFSFLRTPWILVPLALGSIVTELFIADSLWVPSRRRLAAVAGVVLHLGCVAVMDSTLALSVFALACLTLYPLFWAVEPAEMDSRQLAPFARQQPLPR